MPKPIDHVRRYVELFIETRSRTLTATENRRLTASRVVLKNAGALTDVDVLVLAVERGIVTLATLDAAGALDLRNAAQHATAGDLYRRMAGACYVADDPASCEEVIKWTLKARRALRRGARAPQATAAPDDADSNRARYLAYLGTLPADEQSQHLAVALRALAWVLERGQSQPQDAGAAAPQGLPPVDDDPDLPNQAAIDEACMVLLMEVDI
jgi:hypothetical protein